MRSANIYCFRVELSAEGAKRGVETPPKVFPPDDLPRPSRPKAGLGLVMMMMRIMVVMVKVLMRRITMVTVMIVMMMMLTRAMMRRMGW